MSLWICCNSCFKPPGADRQLAITNCGHTICSVCFQKGKEGECLICKAKCRLFPLTDKSSSDVKALFSDMNTVATRYFSEISKVLKFQARHQKRLLTYYEQKNEKMMEALTKMQQEMHQMKKKLTEQSAYISKLEKTLQHQSSSRLGSVSNRELCASTNFKPAHSLSPVMKIPFSSPMSWKHYQSTSSLVENIDIDSRGSHKHEMSGSVSRICLISSPKDGRIGTPRKASQSTTGIRSVRSATVSRDLSSSLKESMLSASSSALYRANSKWELPGFKLAPAYKYPSTSTLGPPP